MAAKQEGQMADLIATLFYRLCPFALLSVTEHATSATTVR